MERKYINNCLTHWTGRNVDENDAFLILKSICEEKILRLSFCPNYVQTDYKPTSQMVCFTEIPLEFSAEHCGIFGKFGIGFDKQNLINYGANPVFYTTKAHLERIKKLSVLLSSMRELEKDREWKEDSQPFSFSEQQTIALNEVTDFLQEYSYKNEDYKEYITYYQREWRISFKTLPLANGDTVQTPGMGSFYMKEGITYPIFLFDRVDVKYIIVPRLFKNKARPLAQQLQCDLKIYENEVKQ